MGIKRSTYYYQKKVHMAKIQQEIMVSKSVCPEKAILMLMPLPNH